MAAPPNAVNLPTVSILNSQLSILNSFLRWAFSQSRSAVLNPRRENGLCGRQGSHQNAQGSALVRGARSDRGDWCEPMVHAHSRSLGCRVNTNGLWPFRRFADFIRSVWQLWCARTATVLRAATRAATFSAGRGAPTTAARETTARDSRASGCGSVTGRTRHSLARCTGHCAATTRPRNRSGLITSQVREPTTTTGLLQTGIPSRHSEIDRPILDRASSSKCRVAGVRVDRSRSARSRANTLRAGNRL